MNETLSVDSLSISKYLHATILFVKHYLKPALLKGLTNIVGDKVWGSNL